MSFARSAGRLVDRGGGRHVANSEITEAAERAYGLLWADHSGGRRANDARKMLRDAIGKEGQRRGIEYARSIYGQTTGSEILGIEDGALVLVPKEPTQEMMEAGAAYLPGGSSPRLNSQGWAARLYAAMLEASRSKPDDTLNDIAAENEFARDDEFNSPSEGDDS